MTRRRARALVPLLLLSPALCRCAGPGSVTLRDPATGQTEECRNAVNPNYPAARVIFGSQEVEQCVAEHRAAGWQRVR